MRNKPKDQKIIDYKDIEFNNNWKKSFKLYENNTKTLKIAREVMVTKARYHANTPMQQNTLLYASFQGKNVKLWMQLIDNFKTFNTIIKARFSSEDDLSILQY